MAEQYVEGVGLIQIDPNKSPEEVQATIDYWKAVTPKQKELTFASGFSETQSMIWRWGEKLLSTQDENKNQWFEDQVKDFGQNIGYYDSLALEKYLSDISETRDLTAAEENDRAANMAIMNQFKKDMFRVYDFTGGDTTQVQKKYGYSPEDISIMDALIAMKDNKAFAAGSIAAAILKDPELLLIGYLRIPSAIATATNASIRAIRAATKIKPNYVKRFEAIAGNRRVVAGVGQGVEGATYGGVYEALHDLTFKGYIDPKNIGKGLAFGALLGTAFGAITKNTSGSWFVDRLGSKKAEAKLQSGEAGFKMKVKIKNNKERVVVEKVKFKEAESNVNPQYKSAAAITALPKGLTHTSRYEKWFNEMQGNKIKELEAWAKKEGISHEEYLIKVKEHEVSLKKALQDAAATIRKNSKEHISGEESLGLATQIRAIGLRQTSQGVKLNKKNWNKLFDDAFEQERKWGNEAIERGDPIPARGKESFTKVLDNVKAEKLPKLTTVDYLKAGGVGASVIAGGFAFNDKDPIMGAIIGGAIGALSRGTMRGVNISTLKMQQEVYKAGRKGEQAKKFVEMEGSSLLKNVQKAFSTKEEGLAILDAVETGSMKGLSKDPVMRVIQEQAVMAYVDVMKRLETLAKKVGVFADESHIEGYVTHIFKGKEATPEMINLIKAAFKKNGINLKNSTGYALPRKLHDTLLNLSKKHDVETDPLLIIDAYTRSMASAISGKVMINEMIDTSIRNGKNLLGIIIPRTEKASIEAAKKLGYKTTDHHALREMYIHPIVKSSIEDFFNPQVGTQTLMNKILRVNNAMKRIAVSMSMFHAQALILSGVYSGALTHSFTKAGRSKTARIRRLMENKWEGKYTWNKENKKWEGSGDFIEADLAREMARYGVEIGHMKTNELVNPGYDTVRNILSKGPLKPLGKLQDTIDRWTWDYLHDYSKIFTYLTKKERLMKTHSIEEASKLAADFVNDAYGGQNWTRMAIKFQQKALEAGDSPKGWLYNLGAVLTAPARRKNANLFLFSPDWTVSNINIIFKGLGYSKNLATKLIKGKKLNPKEVAEWGMYASYMRNALVATSALAYMMHSIFAEDDSELDLQEFWLNGRLDLGNGEEMVVSKQIAEPLHWITSPFHTALNKGATLPKTVIEFLMGKKYITLKYGGGYTGPSLDKSDPMDIAEWASGKITPISINPLRSAFFSDDQPDWGDTMFKSFLGSIGLPKYGSKKREELR